MRKKILKAGLSRGQRLKGLVEERPKKYGQLLSIFLVMDSISRMLLAIVFLAINAVGFLITILLSGRQLF